MDVINDVITYVSVLFSIVGLGYSFIEILKYWHLRNIKKIFGIKPGEPILLICSELADPINRQLVEEREFIYLMKYGDLDAWVECIFSFLRLYPKSNLLVASSGEALQNTMDLECHICLIGGPDYNKLTEHIINQGVTRIDYVEVDNEIAIREKSTGKTFFYQSLDRDYGYIEKIKNPYNKDKNIILFGGCHTVGVTSAVKFLSAYSNGKAKVSDIALNNAKKLVKSKKINLDEFAVLIDARKIASTISYPSFSDLIVVEQELPGNENSKKTISS